MTSRIPTMRRFSLTTRTCIFDEACTDAFLFIGLVLPTCLIQRLALNRICNICFPFVLRQKKKKNDTSLSQRGSLLRIWVPRRRWCQSYNAVLVPVTVSPVGFRRICLSRRNCNIHSFRVVRPAYSRLSWWSSIWSVMSLGQFHKYDEEEEEEEEE